jgi:hypothetical protein
MRPGDDVKRGGRSLGGRSLRSSSATSCFRDCRDGELHDFTGPERVEERSQPVKSLGPNRVETPGSIATFGDQSRVDQHAKMLRDRRSRRSEMFGDFTGCAFRGPNELEDGNSIWLGQRSKHRGACCACAHSDTFLERRFPAQDVLRTAEPVVRTYVSSRCRQHAMAVSRLWKKQFCDLAHRGTCMR